MKIVLEKILVKVSAVLGIILSSFPKKIKKRVANTLEKIFSIIPDRLFIFLTRPIDEALYFMFKNENSFLLCKHGIRDLNFEIDVSEKTQRQIFFFKKYEYALTNFLLRNLKADDVCVDIGANVGYFSLLMASLGAHVHAFEPEKRNYMVFSRHIEINNMINHISLYKKAIGATPEKQTLFVNPFNRGGSSMRKQTGYQIADHTITEKEVRQRFPSDELYQDVDVVSLDIFFTQRDLYDRVQFIKIDVEGCEESVVHGMKNVLQSPSIKNIFCEISTKQSALFIFKNMQDAGFKAYKVDVNGVPRKVKGQVVGDILFSRLEY